MHFPYSLRQMTASARVSNHSVMIPPPYTPDFSTCAGALADRIGTRAEVSRDMLPTAAAINENRRYDWRDPR